MEEQQKTTEANEQAYEVICRYCGLFFEFDSNLFDHQIEFHPTLFATYPPEIIGESASERAGTSQQPVQCSSSIINNFEIQEEDNSASTTRSESACTDTPQLITRPQRRSVAVQLQMNAGFRPFRCNFCNIGYKREKLLQDHMTTVHDPTYRTFHCQICGKEFLRESGLKLHNWIHEGVYPFRCSYCPMQFRLAHCLRRHETISHLEPGGTKNDATKTCNKTKQQQHQTSDDCGNDRRYKCTLCDATFKCSSNLTDHFHRCHGSDNPFQCEICGKSFTRKYSLDLHFAIHTGNFRFQCRYCPQKFRAKKHWRRHEQRRHNAKQQQQQNSFVTDN